jgi:hypothetical protein
MYGMGVWLVALQLSLELIVGEYRAVTSQLTYFSREGLQWLPWFQIGDVESDIKYTYKLVG